MKAVLDHDSISVFAEGLDHSEGIAWGLDGYIYCGGEAGQIYKIDPDDRKVEVIANTGGFILGLTLDGDNNIYACDSGHSVIQKISQNGKVVNYCTGAPGVPMILPNYPVFDRDGNLYIADSGIWGKDEGKIFKILPGGKCEVWCDKLPEFPNGLCLDSDEEFLYVAMSLGPPRVSRVRIEKDGSAGAVETIMILEKTVPDGLAFDIEDNLYISCYRPDAIYRYTKDKQPQLLAEDYEGTLISAPTNIAFCGKNNEILLSTNLGRWHLTKYDLGIKGRPLNYPKISG